MSQICDPKLFFLLCKVPFFWALCLQTYLFFEGCQGFALYAMWSLKVGKVEQIKNEGCHAKDIVTSYIYFRRIAKILQKKNHHELLISHDFQAWSNLSIFCIIVIEDLVKTHLRLTEKKKLRPWNSARKGEYKHELKHDHFHQWNGCYAVSSEKIFSPTFCAKFCLGFGGRWFVESRKKLDKLKVSLVFEWLGFFHQKESDKKGKQGRFPEKVRDDVNRM